MNEKLEKKLFQRFSFFHPEKSVQESLMAFGFSCGDGWYELIWDLCTDIEKEIKKEGITDFEVIQVKEKFGSLRFYADGATDAIYKLIDEAEQKSCDTCELCGCPGETQRINGWYITICNECKSLREKEKENKNEDA